MTDRDNPDPQLRVVDRRWWARGESAADDDAALRKPTYVELELRRAVVQRPVFCS